MGSEGWFSGGAALIRSLCLEYHAGYHRGKSLGVGVGQRREQRDELGDYFGPGGRWWGG